MIRAIADTIRGVAAAVGGRPKTFLVGTLAILGLSIALPPLLLSLARKPVDYFTLNPWLGRLPEYVASPTIPLAQKIEKLPDLALFWFSADSPHGGTEWGFAVDVRDLLRIVATSVLFGLYFALWLHRRDRMPAAASCGRLGRQGGVMGAFVSVFGLSTGPCSVMGCGAPVLPVVGLAFAGLTSGTLTLLATLATVATPVVLVALTLAVAYLGWGVGARRQEPATPR